MDQDDAELIKSTAKKLASERKKLKTLETKTATQKSIVTELSDKMLELMQNMGTLSYKNATTTFSVSKSDVPTVENWDKFNAYILKNGALDLLQRRVSTTAWRDRVEDGQRVPGVTKFNKATLRIKQS